MDPMTSQTTGGDSQAPPAWIRDFERAQKHLRVRLCPAEALAGPAGQSVIRQDPVEGLAAVLAMDLEGDCCDLRPEDIVDWATPEAALFAIGINNLREVFDLKTTERELSGGTKVLAVRGDSPFVSAQLLVLDRFMREPPPYGSLAAVPKRDLLLVHPIVTSRAVDAADELVQLVEMLHRGDEGGLSPLLYWWNKRALTHLPTMTGPKGLTIDPPPRFVSRVMEPLSET